MVKEMNDPDKDVSSSTLIKASVIPRASATDENDQSHQQMGPNSPNPKKLTQKHYMSPTISAASKAIIPKKKILAERNEASESIFSEPVVQKTPNLESKTTSSNPLTEKSDIASPQGFEPNGNGNEENVVADGSLRPYDPLTNYLSPRPKFLRYKPNRRQEILHRLENEIPEGKDGLSSTSGSSESQKVSDEESDSGSGHGSLISSTQEGSRQQEHEEIEESDEENEEVEEEKVWSVKRVLESLFWFVLLVISTLYISSMNSPEPSPSLQSFEGPKYGYCEIQNRTLEAFMAKKVESGSNIWDQRDELQMALDQVSQKSDDEWIKEEKMVQDVKMGGVDIVEEFGEVIKLEGGESEAIEVDEDGMKGVVGELGEVLDLHTEDIEANFDHQRMFASEISGQIDENSELQNAGNIEKFEAFQDYKAPSLSDGVDHQIMESDIANVLEEENDVWVKEAEEVVNEKAGDEEMVERKMEGMENVTIKAGEVINNGDTDTEILNFEVEEELEEGLKKQLETDSLLKLVIGVSVFSMIVAFLVLGFHFKRKKALRKDSSLIAKPCSEALIVEKEKKDSSLIPIQTNKATRKDSFIVKPCTESGMGDKCSSELPNREELHTERVDSFRSHPSFHPMEEVPKHDYESRAPSVELLGEFEVGEVSSSLRSSGVKNRRMEIEESSKYSVSTEKKSGSKAHPIPVQSQSTFSEFSTGESHSYGRFTAERKIVKEGRDGEVQEVTTPVRRSSRIRNRSVMSP
ncbi:uncharacterized protein LOC115992680 [Quercus lobata]|uniref:Uncharacterized protein n=1 Tax=Quercus lobata TaxID=97700 RepID=A0A7N2LP71_QUELO|nr:uncharacterized protein LOC115992680 [Quercus lobata]